jgi:hypothetical protein
MTLDAHSVCRKYFSGNGLRRHGGRSGVVALDQIEQLETPSLEQIGKSRFVRVACQTRSPRLDAQVESIVHYITAFFSALDYTQQLVLWLPAKFLGNSRAQGCPVL